jgi:hypothetical protein
MLTLILALAIAEPAATTAPPQPDADVVAEAPRTAVVTAKTPTTPRMVCKWRSHSSGIPILYCGSPRKWRDEKINHQQDIEVDQRRLLVSAPY